MREGGEGGEGSAAFGVEQQTELEERGHPDEEPGQPPRQKQRDDDQQAGQHRDGDCSIGIYNMWECGRVEA